MLLQRVTRASVSIEGHEVGRIGQGLVVLAGIAHDDTEEDARYLVEKVLNLRIFADEASKFNRSALMSRAELLIISQFTLYAETRRGRRPSFDKAALPQKAKALYQQTVELFEASGLRTETGRFQEHMLVEIHNDGPVTIVIDSAERRLPRRSV